MVSIYSGKNNIFTRRSSPADLASVLRLITEASAESLHVRFGQVLSPAGFLEARGALPDEAKAYVFQKRKTAGNTQMVDGRPAYVVGALADPAFVQSLAPEIRVVPRRREMFLWIDTHTYLLVRAAIALTWLSTRPGEDRRRHPTARGGFAFEEAHRDTRLNAPIDDSVFRFIPPRRALEKFPHQHV
jgi:hypothetical protein